MVSLCGAIPARLVTLHVGVRFRRNSGSQALSWLRQEFLSGTLSSHPWALVICSRQMTVPVRNAPAQPSEQSSKALTLNRDRLRRLLHTLGPVVCRCGRHQSTAPNPESAGGEKCAGFTFQADQGRTPCEAGPVKTARRRGKSAGLRGQKPTPANYRAIARMAKCRAQAILKNCTSHP